MIAPVVGSGAWPAWMAAVEKPGPRAVFFSSASCARTQSRDAKALPPRHGTDLPRAGIPRRSLPSRSALAHRALHRIFRTPPGTSLCRRPASTRLGKRTTMSPAYEERASASPSYEELKGILLNLLG